MASTYTPQQPETNCENQHGSSDQLNLPHDLHHSAAIASMCRACGERHTTALQTKSKNHRKRPVSSSADQMLEFFDINVSADQSDTHPAYLCEKCYNKIRHTMKNGAKHDFLKSKVKYMDALWSSCKGAKTPDDCRICQTYIKQSVGGRPKKPPKKRTCDKAKKKHVIDMSNYSVVSDTTYKCDFCGHEDDMKIIHLHSCDDADIVTASKIRCDFCNYVGDMDTFDLHLCDSDDAELLNAVSAAEVMVINQKSPSPPRKPPETLPNAEVAIKDHQCPDTMNVLAPLPCPNTPNKDPQMDTQSTHIPPAELSNDKSDDQRFPLLRSLLSTPSLQQSNTPKSSNKSVPSIEQLNTPSIERANNRPRYSPLSPVSRFLSPSPFGKSPSRYPLTASSTLRTPLSSRVWYARNYSPLPSPSHLRPSFPTECNYSPSPSYYPDKSPKATSGQNYSPLYPSYYSSRVRSGLNSSQLSFTSTSPWSAHQNYSPLLSVSRSHLSVSPLPVNESSGGGCTSQQNPYQSKAPPDPAQPVESPISPATRNRVLMDLISIPVNSTPSKLERKALSQTVKRELYQSSKHGDSQCIVLPTGGQPVVLTKLTKARKPSSSSDSPLKRRRARELNKTARRIISGEDDTLSQMSSELKRLDKEERQEVCGAAGLKPARITADMGLALKSDMNISWAQRDKMQRFLKEIGVEQDNKMKQRNRKNELLGDHLISKMVNFEFRDEDKNIFIKPAPLVYVKNIQEFLMERLDDLAEHGMLTWHQDPNGRHSGGSLPLNKIFVKVGGDKGQGSMKVTLQICNVHKPNSPDNTLLLAVYEAGDSYNNLATALDGIAQQIIDLDGEKWEYDGGYKTIELVGSGDCEFMFSCLGLGGASGLYPCYDCEIDRHTMQYPKSERGPARKRTLESLSTCYSKFVTDAKCNAKKQSKFLNVINPPLLSLPPSRFTVPMLHVVLGSVKKMHLLLEADCSNLDDMLGSKAVSTNLENKLQKFNIKRQKFHGKSFIGNDCDRYLERAVYSEICQVVVTTTKQITADQEHILRAKSITSKHHKLWNLFSHVYDLVKHSNYLSENDILEIGKAVDEFMAYFRRRFPNESIPLKFHIIEDHLVDSCIQYRYGLGLFGEQGVESIHHRLKEVGTIFRSMVDSQQRLKSTVEEHHISTLPTIRSLIPIPPKRGRKRKLTD